MQDPSKREDQMFYNILTYIQIHQQADSLFRSKLLNNNMFVCLFRCAMLCALFQCKGRTDGSVVCVCVSIS